MKHLTNESSIKHIEKEESGSSQEKWKKKTQDYWRENLTELQYQVTQKSATESPGSGFFDQFTKDGDYFCTCCGEILFKSDSKFDAGCGWPSFSEVAAQGRINYFDDYSLTRKRTEVKCANCDAHLGHVFDDGPTESGKRYCINSVCLGFNQKK
jgi:peptide-methionine (R)-S-oxide reductase